MISIPVSGTVFVILLVIGVVAYVGDGVSKVREHRARKAERAQLKADLQAPEPPTRLPYGVSEDPAGEDR